ncbi:MAG TPA: antibiotic biosynthesis monooxygenase [Niabella sp.]
MVTELAILTIKPAQDIEFRRAFNSAVKFINTISGYIGHELLKCMETENRYALIVRWQTLEDHTIGFRQSAQYQEWRKLLHSFYDPLPVVEHYV